MNEDAIEANAFSRRRIQSNTLLCTTSQDHASIYIFDFNHFEIGVRSAATLGLVGAGIGACVFAIQARNWDKSKHYLISSSCDCICIRYRKWMKQRKKLK